MLSGRDVVREKVRMRDNRTCQDCGKIWEEGNRRFDIHHLNGLCGKKSKGYDRVADMDGLITLCHRCHFKRPEHKNNSPEWLAKHRNLNAPRMLEMRHEGRTFKEIGDIFGISSQRVHILVRREETVDNSVEKKVEMCYSVTKK